MEHGMVTGTDNDVEVSGWAAVQPGIAFTRNSNALSIAGAGLDSHFKRLGALDCPFAMADRAGGNVFSGAVAARASHVALHASTGLLDFPIAFAFRQYARRLAPSPPAPGWPWGTPPNPPAPVGPPRA